MRFIFSLVLALSFSATVAGKEVSFKTKALERLYFAVEADKVADTSLPGGAVIQGIINDTPWYAAIDSDGMVSHVGYALFDEELRTSLPPEVADFIERYILEVSLCPASKLGEKLKLDRVSFLSDRIPVPAKLRYPDSFSLKLDEKGYSAEWNTGEKDQVMMFFPASFELILGAGQVEMENRMMADMLKEREDYSYSSDSRLLPLSDDPSILRTSPVETYCIEAVSNSRYYRIDAQSGAVIPLFDSGKLEESVSNLLLLDCFDNLDMHVTQSLYGFKTVSYTVKLGQWQKYCARHHLKAYVGIESIEENKIVKALLIARNEAVGYNHILSIIVSKDVFDGTSHHIDAVLNAFIPTHNILSLF